MSADHVKVPRFQEPRATEMTQRLTSQILAAFAPGKASLTQKEIAQVMRVRLTPRLRAVIDGLVLSGYLVSTNSVSYQVRGASPKPLLPLPYYAIDLYPDD